jgi:putative flippase GtrA
VVYGGTSLIGFLLLPVLMAALNLFVSPLDAVPYLAGAILTAGTVVVSFFGHKRYTFAQTPSPQVDRVTGRDG